MVTEFLKGKWLGHPLHPAIVHIPVALWPAALVFDLLSQFNTGGNILVRLAFFSILGGLLATILAVPTGVMDWVGVKKENRAWKLGLYHMMLNLIVAVIYAINFGLRLETFQTVQSVPLLPVILSVIGTIVLGASGYLGGLMVYEYGLGVARMSKDKWRKVAEAGGAKLPPQQEKGHG